MARADRILVVFLLMILATVAGCGPEQPATPPGTSPGTSPGADGGAPPPAYGLSAQKLTVGGKERTYQLYRPAGLPTPAPLVVMLHGALGTGKQAASSYNWTGQADRGRFVVAFPDGLSRSWAVSPDCCGPPARDGVDDVGFITALVATIGRGIPIDPARVYATGISNGGMLAYRLACDTSTFAAIAPVAATMLPPCPSPHRVSVIHIHGTADQTIPYGGGPGKRDNGGQGRNPVRIDGPAVPALFDQWRAIDGCDKAAVSVAAPVTTSTATCADGRTVELIAVDGAGHQWPGSAGPGGVASSLLNLDPPSDALDATDTIWGFFAAHPRPN